MEALDVAGFLDVGIINEVVVVALPERDEGGD